MAPKHNSNPASAAEQSKPARSSKQALLQHPNLWRAGELLQQQRQSQAALSTGFIELDEHLPDHGWPAGGLVELILANAGTGELRLLLPVLRALTQGTHAQSPHTQSEQESRWLTWINPPFTPYAPALQSAGVDISKILLIHPQQHKDALWAVERASRSGACGAVFAWLDEKKLKSKDTQRLQIAAKQGGTLSCLFRPHTAQRLPSMAELRLAVQATPTPGVSCVNILKRRGGWPVEGIELALNAVSQTGYQPRNVTAQLALWRAFFEASDSEASNSEESEHRRSAAHQSALDDAYLPFANDIQPPRVEQAARLH